MVTVPTPGAPLEPAPFRAPTLGRIAPPGAFGEGVSAPIRQAQALSQEAQKAFLEERARADQTVLMSKRRVFNDWEAARIYDEKEGALTKLGRNAFGLPEEVLKDFDDLVERESRTLVNPQQRAVYFESTNARRKQIQRVLQRHVAKQISIAEGAEYDASIQSSKERGARDALVRGTELAQMKEWVRQRGKDLGLDAKSVKLEVVRHESEFHLGVMRKMLNEGQYLKATEYWKGIKKRMSLEANTRASNMLEVGSTLGEAQMQTDRIWEKQLTLSESRSLAREIENPKVREMTLRFIARRFDEMDQERARAADRIYQEMTRRQDQSPDTPPELLFDQEELNSLPTRLRDSIFARVKERPTNQRVWGQFLNRFKTNQAALEKMLFSELESEFLIHFNKSDRANATRMWLSAKKPDAAEFTSFFTREERIRRRFAEAGMLPAVGKLSKAKELFLDRAKAILETRVRAFEATNLQNERKATDDEVMNILEKSLQEKIAETDTFLWIDFLNPDDVFTIFDLPPGEIEDVKVPAEIEVEIINELKESGVRPTQSRIARLYISRLAGDQRMEDKVLSEKE